MPADDFRHDPLTKACAGNVQAFGELVDRHEGWLRAMLRSRLPDWSAADDLAQDVFVTAFRQIRGFRGDGCFEAWLRSIAINHLRNFRRKCREEYIGGSLELDSLMNHQPRAVDAGGIPLDSLRECLGEIGDEARQLLERRYVHGSSVREISVETGRGYSALTMQFHRLREILANCIETKTAENFL